MIWKGMRFVFWVVLIIALIGGLFLLTSGCATCKYPNKSKYVEQSRLDLVCSRCHTGQFVQPECPDNCDFHK